MENSGKIVREAAEYRLACKALMELGVDFEKEYCYIFDL
jgi:hypothetical protein